MSRQVLVWNEFIDERRPGPARDCYPEGIHETIARGLRSSLPGTTVGTATLQDADHGITDETLEPVSVLVWWSHVAHEQVPASVVETVHEHVLRGMGIILLHSSAESKIFKRLMGTTCSFRWRESGDRQLVWVTDPSHPIAAGLPPVIELAEDETYSEYFDIPKPEAVVFISSFTGGEVFRSGCTFRRGDGKVFFFSPGHETFPVYHDKLVQQVMANAVVWADAGRAQEPRRLFLHSPEGWYRSPATP
ncbi:MAG: ThuA domain-containing protein [Acidimicrobiales bacterium]